MKLKDFDLVSDPSMNLGVVFSLTPTLPLRMTERLFFFSTPNHLLLSCPRLLFFLRGSGAVNQ